jgi:hypothetical protein
VQYLFAQDSIQYRVILIGDAGEINTSQKAILSDIINRSLPDKTMALFLGDNVYPKGIETEATKQQTSQSILRSQFEGLRKNGIPVYFVPGNHDWDKSGPDGYKKMMAANAFIASQQDSLLKLIPADACPGPYELTITDNLVIVAMDSEWWLYPFNNHADRSDCICKTKRDVLGRLEDILLRNKDKLILFATHHPFKTYGTHGGYYTLKDHLFPFTNLNKQLYIPLPVIGSLYPLLREIFPPAEDLGNVLNRDMQQMITAILKKHLNVIQVSGHEHTLQLIQGEVLQVVSGAGSKFTPVRKGKGSIYASATSGYVQADILKDNSIRLTYFIYSKDGIRQDFIYTKPYTICPVADIFTAEAITTDSIRLPLKKEYDNVSKIHRSLFGENYRKVWAAETKVPVLRLSAAGLEPRELGGGMQTHSLRLTDSLRKEWVLRSIDKFPDALLPKALNQTLASKLLQDNVSANFPFAPLVVPVIADALGVPHSNPSVVYISPDKQLGIYSRDFANTVALLEEREPLGKSISTLKMQEKLKEDNDNSVDQRSFLTARIQDIFLGDWDRHGDQWRWIDDQKGKEKLYRAVPRDRDQVFYINKGLFPKILSLPWIMPKFQGFGAGIRNVNTFAFNARLLDGIYSNALSYDDWMNAAQYAVNALKDSVIEYALQKMPSNIYQANRNRLFDQLQKRRQDLLRVLPIYYRFLNKTIDVITSDKNELVIINDTPGGKLTVQIFKITNENITGKLLYYRILDPAVTKELRLFVNGGEDNVIISNNHSAITIRIIGDGISAKKYQFSGGAKYLRKVHVYEGSSNAVFKGKYNPVHQHLSNDADNTALQLTDRYNKTIPLFSSGYNADDGLLLGAGVKWIRQGFRKLPYASLQQFFVVHAFANNAYRVNYKGEWWHVWHHTDITLQANAFAPDNTQNFFGRGNESVFDKTGDYKKYYKARFDQFTINPAFRWRSAKSNSFSIGPSFQYYQYDPADNTGRFITNSSLLHTYDSTTLANDKAHLGLMADYTHDSRNSELLPAYGAYINLQMQGFTGLNKYSKSYLQLVGQIIFYKSIDRKSNFIFTNRTGGGYTAGNTTFYQSLFLGGHANLQGYRQFRFAGEHMLYNNTEIRIKLTNLASYILPGQLGMVGFYDIGKVWQNGYNNSTWHQGAGGGFYFAPAGLFVFQLVAARSDEGWYPYFTAGFRF